MKKLLRRLAAALTALAASLTVVLCLTPLKADAYAFTPPFTINSKSGVVVNMDSGTIIYEKNADRQEMPSHLAQIMTAIIVMENCPNLDAQTITMTVNPKTVFKDYYEPDDIRYAGIESADTLTVREYLYAMMLTSGCEAAYILAQHIGGGSIDTFVGMMNEKAAQIGCTGTHFTNPTGLYDKYQITTARDMMLITKYALENVPGFEEIATADTYTSVSGSLSVSYALNGWTWNHANTMTAPENLFYYEGVKGIKTGNLSDCGRSIATMATRDGVTYLLVLLNAPFENDDGDLMFYHIEDATDLLNWSFESFQYTTLIGDDEEIAELPVTDGSDKSFVLVKPESSVSVLWCTDVDISAVQRVPSYYENISAPIKKGDVLGSLDLKFSGEVIATTPLVAVSDVERSPLKHNAVAFITYFTDSDAFSAFHVSLIIAGIISLGYIIICIYAAFSAAQRQKAAQAVHIVPRSVSSVSKEPQQKRAWKRDDTVFYKREE